MSKMDKVKDIDNAKYSESKSVKNSGMLVSNRKLDMKKWEKGLQLSPISEKLKPFPQTRKNNSAVANSNSNKGNSNGQNSRSSPYRKVISSKKPSFTGPASSYVASRRSPGPIKNSVKSVGKLNSNNFEKFSHDDSIPSNKIKINPSNQTKQTTIKAPVSNVSTDANKIPWLSDVDGCKKIKGEISKIEKSHPPDVQPIQKLPSNLVGYSSGNTKLNAIKGQVSKIENFNNPESKLSQKPPGNFMKSDSGNSKLNIIQGQVKKLEKSRLKEETSQNRSGGLLRSSSGNVKLTLRMLENDKQPESNKTTQSIARSQSANFKKGVDKFTDSKVEYITDRNEHKFSSSNRVKKDLAVFEKRTTEFDDDSYVERKNFVQINETNKRVSRLIETTEKVPSLSKPVIIEPRVTSNNRPKTLDFYQPNNKDATEISTESPNLVPWSKTPTKMLSPNSCNKPNKAKRPNYAPNQFEAVIMPREAEEKKREISHYFEESSKEISARMSKSRVFAKEKSLSIDISDFDNLLGMDDDVDNDQLDSLFSTTMLGEHHDIKSYENYMRYISADKNSESINTVRRSNTVKGKYTNSRETASGNFGSHAFTSNNKNYSPTVDPNDRVSVLRDDLNMAKNFLEKEESMKCYKNKNLSSFVDTDSDDDNWEDCVSDPVSFLQPLYIPKMCVTDFNPGEYIVPQGNLCPEQKKVDEYGTELLTVEPTPVELLKVEDSTVHKYSSLVQQFFNDSSMSSFIRSRSATRSSSGSKNRSLSVDSSLRCSITSNVEIYTEFSGSAISRTNSVMDIESQYEYLTSPIVNNFKEFPIHSVHNNPIYELPDLVQSCYCSSNSDI